MIGAIASKEDIVQSMLDNTKYDIEAEQRVVEECCENIARELEGFNLLCSPERLAVYSRQMLEAANNLRTLEREQKHIEWIIEHFDIIPTGRERDDNDEE